MIPNPICDPAGVARPARSELLAILKGRLLISCQDYEEVMIPVAVSNGAAGLRLNGPPAVRFARSRTTLPILACNKIYFPGSDVFITPSLRSAHSLLDAGADLVALDARALPRPRQSAAEIIAMVHQRGCLAVADVATVAEGMEAWRQGADVVATTLASEFSPELVGQLAAAGCRVLAEGQINAPERVTAAMAAGAWAVCVGTAITRPHVLISQFLEALK